MGFGFTGLGTAAGAGDGLRKLIAQRLAQAQFEELSRHAHVAEDQTAKTVDEQIAMRKLTQQGLDQSRAEAAKDRDLSRAINLAQIYQGHDVQTDPQTTGLLREAGFGGVLKGGGMVPSPGDTETPGTAEEAPSTFMGSQLAKPTAAGSGGTPEEAFILAYAKARNKTPEQLTDAERLDARKKWGLSDNAPQRPFAPIVIQTQAGPQILDRSAGTARPITDAGGDQVHRQPTGTEMTAGEDAYVALGLLDQIGQSPYRKKVGLIPGMTQGVKAVIPGMSPDPDYPDFASASIMLKNATIKAITGAQMSQGEAQRITQQIPQVTDKDVMWEAKFRQSTQNLHDIIESKSMGIPLDELLRRRAGSRGQGQTQPSRAGGPGPVGTSQPGVTSPVTPSPEVQKWGRDAQGRPVRLP